VDSAATGDEAGPEQGAVLAFASMAVHCLAGVPSLREPVGEAGAVPALVSIVRRCVQLCVRGCLGVHVRVRAWLS